MDFRRIFLSAVARRVAYVLVVALFAWLGVGSARAANCMAAADRCDQGEAYSAAWDYAQSASAGVARAYPCVVAYSGSPPYRGGRVAEGSPCAAGTAWQVSASFFYASDKKCSSRSSTVTRFLPVTGSVGCNRGCSVSYAQNADETSFVSTTGTVCTLEELKKNCASGSYWNGYMGVCEPVDKPCPPGQKKQNGQCVPDGKCPDGMISVQGTTPGAVQQGSLYCKPAENECPAGNVKSPTGQCLPGEGQCAAGEAKRENGTCGKDKDGDGKADEDDDDSENDPKKDSASGGDSCDTPPSCSGNAISCMQVKIQWRIDCNTRRQVNISGGTCSAVPICTGDGCNAMEYAQLMQQWRSTCALEKLASETGEDGASVGDANKNGVADVLEGTGNVSDPGDGASDVEGAKRFGIGVSTDRLDKENIFGSGSCPEPPSFQIMGFSISNDFPYWCQAMAILRALVLMFGAFVALKILMGGVI